mmetsp:Transcript_26294/g.57696  ORF Transcript_26294/g.57696 Transcript_26294/m.57696 type:complete len:260 (-) Transcript_26294:14-793(-)
MSPYRGASSSRSRRNNPTRIFPDLPVPVLHFLLILVVIVNASIVHAAATSVDKLPDCQSRAKRGECKSNPADMLKNCAASCEAVGARKVQVERIPDDHPTFYDLGVVRDAHGKDIDLRQFEGYVTIVVSIPRTCGLTERYYAALDHLEEIWPWSVEVVAFPFRIGQKVTDVDACPQHSVADLSEKRRISVMEEVDINGSNTHRVFQYMKELFRIDDGELDEVGAMFFLVNPDGSTIEAHYRSSPTHVKDYIKKHLEHDL